MCMPEVVKVEKAELVKEINELFERIRDPVEKISEEVEVKFRYGSIEYRFDDDSNTHKVVYKTKPVKLPLSETTEYELEFLVHTFTLMKILHNELLERLTNWIELS